MSNRLITVLSVLTALCGFSSLAHAAPGDGAVIAGFLTSAEGDFTGNGKYTTSNDGTNSTLGYAIEFKIGASESAENTFTVDSQTNGDDGSIHSTHDSLLVQGDNLIYTDIPIASFPTKLISVSATDLTFSIAVVSNMNGQIYDIVTHLSLAGDTLTGSTVTSTNGVIVSDDEFSGTRF